MIHVLLLAIGAVLSRALLCGRFNLTDPRAIEQRFGFFDWHEKRIEPRFNIAPSQDILIVSHAPGAQRRQAHTARWGFAPRWASSAQTRRPPPINARSETIHNSALFREALSHSRCLIPASGFYEWQSQPGGGRQPMHIRLKSGELFAFAGLWTPDQRDRRPTAVILTCGPNSLLAQLHNRMPVIIRPEDEALWLDANVTDVDRLLGVLGPYPAELMEAYPVSTAVNSFQNEGPTLIAPVAPASQQLSLL